MKRFIFLFTFFCFCSKVFTQAPESWTSSEMYLAIKKLNVLGSVLYIAAHPDDENTRLLTYLANEKLYRTGYLSLTRGDGGQNLIGDEQGVDLGLIRTQELLAARSIDGAEQFFTRAFDFGYSKTANETFSKWNKEKILNDVVWVIRKFRPEVIICRFPTTGEGGHGHHTASAILAGEAFNAAADPNRFPEQLTHVQPWQAKRIIWNTFNFSGANTIAENQFKIDVGGYNPLLGKSYGEIAAESRSQHKSQGFGVARGRGESFEYFRPIAGIPLANDLFDEIETSWKKVAGTIPIQEMITEITRSFDLVHPEKSVKQLVKLYRSIKDLPSTYWKEQKEKEVLQLIEQCSGLWIDVVSNKKFAVQTDSIQFQCQINNRQGIFAVLNNISIENFDSSFQLILAKNKNINIFKTLFVTPQKAITQPYWLEEKMDEGSFNVSNPLQIGTAGSMASFIAQFSLTLEGEQIKFSKPVQYKFTDPVRGEIYQPLVVTPPILVMPDEKVKMSIGKNQFGGTLHLLSKKKNTQVLMRYPQMIVQAEPIVEFSTQQINFSEEDRSVAVEYKIETNKNNEYTFAAAADGTLFTKGINEIQYEHIPAIHYFEDARVVNRKLELKTVGKKIGYIIGAGDKVPAALEQMGYEVVFLDAQELSKNNLQQFDAIITGVRAYNTNEWLPNFYTKLMSYIENGGNLIVQYNTNNLISKMAAKMGPVEFTISRNRITNENAPVEILKPHHPVFNFPNKISKEDFEGWVQERSIYHASNYGQKFEAMLSMQDPDEPLDEGSLVVAKHGKGYFVYTGLTFFRQLPAGVAGAYRLLANILALNQLKTF